MKLLRSVSGDHADHVPRAVPHLEGALEPDDRRPRLQRAQDIHGDELAPLRRPHRQLQGREIKVSPVRHVGLL